MTNLTIGDHVTDTRTGELGVIVGREFDQSSLRVYLFTVAFSGQVRAVRPDRLAYAECAE